MCLEAAMCTVQELKTQLEPELLRGVPLDVALAGWGRHANVMQVLEPQGFSLFDGPSDGRHWETPDSGMFNVDPESYELSRPTESLDVFLSHDWASSGTLKFLSLLIICNSRAAFLACLTVSIVVGVLRGYELLPDEGWTVVLGHATFLLVFAFWQRIRRTVCRPLMVFLDKLCVAQHDEQLLGRPSSHAMPAMPWKKLAPSARQRNFAVSISILTQVPGRSALLLLPPYHWGLLISR